MKWSKTKSLITLLVLAGLSLVSWTLYLYCNKQYYGQFFQYSGKAKIDNYEIIADGAGAIVHWTSITPEEDKKMAEFGSHFRDKIDQKSSRYILRQNVKLKELPYRLMERPSDGAYWTLSVYRINDKKLEEEKEIDLYKVVENYNSNYLPAELGGIYTWQGQDYLWIQIRDLENPQETRPLFLNLKSRKMEEIEILAQDYVRKPFIRLATNWDQKASGIYTTTPGGEVRIDKSVLGQTQFDSSSKAYKLLEKKGTTVYLLHSQNSAEGFSREAAVYSLLMPDTVNVYEAVTIPPEVSVDSQEHIVNSKEEFDRYYDIEKAKKLYHETE
ncbi:hypothetical protein [Streptococcus sanguinis]|uniref:hypothetical protein n=1 Tax=Streptococcus sanguinis TaxID=1305 RepID=UPI001CBCA4F2|nr:hypothetical protein [Streptococcus sanguinis]MBZ2038177.1 hypothetical protein [Streptococcus sanguinis]MBZ2068949.1 hypothetical protein [Streptococcus sanguinis]MBZ2070560.1 hypothetical protein [Streptococcus sanguinis]MBZ2073569.1 hypothetical protein [Streptococcus sanguinis]MBZ2081493.1 hypothetical protein [Streptococcus sanguinis]